MCVTRIGLPLIIIKPRIMGALFGLGFGAITDRVGRIIVIIVIELIVEAVVILLVVAITNRWPIGFALAGLNGCLAQQS
jgi:NADH:ubiquinone oxidoreductase subunit K